MSEKHHSQNFNVSNNRWDRWDLSIEKSFTGKYQIFAKIALKSVKKIVNLHSRSIGGGEDDVPQLLTFCCRLYSEISLSNFVDNISNRKRCTYLKGCFKTLSKSRNIKLLVHAL